MTARFCRRFLVLTFTLAVLVGGQPAAADPISVGDSIRFSDGPGSTGGGEFKATDINSAWSFITFCLQMTEYINFTSNFRVAGITNYAVSDPSTRGGDADGKDFLDPRTAWLYAQFRDGTLEGYNYNGTFSERTASANLLQTAIWMIEEEIALNPSQFYVALATQAGWSDIGDVRVLNLERYVNGQWVESQDQLARVPEPRTLLLLGLASALIPGRSRRGKRSV